MMAGSESWGLVGAGGRSFDFFFSLVFFSVLVGEGGRTGYAKKKQNKQKQVVREDYTSKDVVCQIITVAHMSHIHVQLH